MSLSSVVGVGGCSNVRVRWKVSLYRALVSNTPRLRKEKNSKPVERRGTSYEEHVVNCSFVQRLSLSGEVTTKNLVVAVAKRWRGFVARG